MLTDNANAPLVLIVEDDDIRTGLHDLKSPLCVIKANTWMMMKDIGTGDQARVEVAIKRIEGAVSKMTCQINELLELTRSDMMFKHPSQMDSKESTNDRLPQV